MRGIDTGGRIIQIALILLIASAGLRYFGDTPIYGTLALVLLVGAVVIGLVGMGVKVRSKRPH